MNLIEQMEQQQFSYKEIKQMIDNMAVQVLPGTETNEQMLARMCVNATLSNMSNLLLSKAIENLNKVYAEK